MRPFTIDYAEAITGNLRLFKKTGNAMFLLLAETLAPPLNLAHFQDTVDALGLTARVAAIKSLKYLN